MRWLRHLFLDEALMRRAFPPAALAEIERTVAEAERRHRGEIRVAIEGGLPLAALLRRVSPRERALEVFTRLRVWDTEENAGVLIYVLLADRDVEIVADRGIHARAGEAAWEEICRAMEREFAAGRYLAGMLAGIGATSALLAQHFPAREGPNPDELPNAPAVI
ncbi:MAG: TPM domain-containing protein [Burkholderiales bacterium]|nr:TPM domain-containing protein [Burkholderiales bacterium]